jgi:DNA-directed RNA polymerase specialized sigma24 family protein
MSGLDDLDRRGRELLAALARDPDSDCWRQFDALFYELVWKYLRTNHAKLAARVARYLKVDGAVAPDVLLEEVDEVAHEATKIALRRVRENAARFDPARGTPTRWVIGSAEYAYTEVAKAVVAARRSDRLGFVSPADLVEVPDPNPTTEEHVLRHLDDADALEYAARHTSELEFAAIRLVVTLNYTYAEAAELMFGDPSMTKRVEGLLTRGKRKLADAWRDRKSSPSGAAGSKVPNPAEDFEGSDE